jgi:alcohol dehydrogenase
LIHSLESFISLKANTLSDGFALRSMALINGSIEKAFTDGEDMVARFDMLIGACLGGMALTAAGTAAVHALSYPLGGRFHVPHGVANAMLLIPVMEFNADACWNRLASAAEAFQQRGGARRGRGAAESVLARLREMVAFLKIPQHLAAFGVQESDLEELAGAAMQVTRLLANNPKPMDAAAIRDIYARIL